VTPVVIVDSVLGAVLFIIAGLVAFCIVWMLTHREHWPLAIPVAFLLFHAAVRNGVILWGDLGREWITALNIWGQVLLIQALLTLMMYMFIMPYKRNVNGAPRGNTEGSTPSKGG
jgi:hypothetical protein